MVSVFHAARSLVSLADRGLGLVDDKLSALCP
jgi:hypothetical protein